MYNKILTTKSFFKYILPILMVGVLIIVIGNIYLNNNQNNQNNPTVDIPIFDNNETNKTKIEEENRIKFEERTKELEILYEEPVEEQEIKSVDKKEEFHFLEKKKIKKVVKENKPKLVIIIDDITRKSQVKKAHKLPFGVTLSFLPPTSIHKYSDIISYNEKIAMIHLPLEAKNRKHEEENTLHIGDSLSKIDKRIKYLKRIYPNIKYINNHTGSKFTASKDSIDKLIKTLKKYNYSFVDSRTTAKTVIVQYAKKYHISYLQRNIFLDNEKNKKYIQNQLRKAVRSAIKRGYAIAICHPYSITYKTLMSSKHILKNVELVSIDKLKFK